MDTVVRVSLSLHFVTPFPCIHAKVMPEVKEKSREKEERGEDKRTTVEKETEPEPTLKKPEEVNKTGRDSVLWCIPISSVQRYGPSVQYITHVQVISFGTQANSSRVHRYCSSKG